MKEARVLSPSPHSALYVQQPQNMSFCSFFSQVSSGGRCCRCGCQHTDIVAYCGRLSLG